MNSFFDSKARSIVLLKYALVSMALLISVFARASVKVGDLYYNFNSNLHTATVTYSALETTDNYSGLSTIVVPDSVIYEGATYVVNAIGEKAFNRAPVYSIELPNTLTTIGKESFAVTSNLKKVTIPEGVISMGDNVFMSSDIEEIVLPNTLEKLPYGACADMSELRKITLGSGLRSIAGEAFNYTNSLEEIVCKAEVVPQFESGRGSTFTSGVYSSAKLYVLESLVGSYGSSSDWGSFANIFAIEGNIEEGEEGDENLPSATERVKIGQYYYYLNSENFTATVTYSHYQSSENYKGLTTIMLPSKVEFGGKEYTVTKIGESAFDRCYDITEVVLPESITEIEKDGLCSNRLVKNIIIGNAVTKIGYGAFAYNYQLEKLIIGENVSFIDGEAFNYDTKLTEIQILATIPPALGTGRGGVFCSQTYANAVLIVPSGTAGAYRQTEGWKNFANIKEYTSDIVKIDGIFYLLDKENNTATVYYESLNPADNYRNLSSVAIPSSITYNSDSYSVLAIGDMAFRGSSLSAISLGEGIKTIGISAFSELTSEVEKIEMPQSLEAVGNSAFASSRIKNIIFGNSLSWLGANACSGNGALVRVEFGDNKSAIGAGAFNGCGQLEEIVCRTAYPPMFENTEADNFESGIYGQAVLRVPSKGIDAYATADVWKNFLNVEPLDLPSGRFKIGQLYYNLDGENATAEVTYQYYENDNNYSYLTTVSIPDTVAYSGGRYAVVKIGKSAFDRAYNLTHADVPNTVTDIEENGFCSNHSLQSIVLGDNVKTLGYGSFAFNYELTSVTIGANITSIGGESFYQSSKLKEIICRATTPPSTSTNWMNVFSSTQYNSTILYVPKGCKSKYKSASNWCNFKDIREFDEKEEIEYEYEGIHYILYPNSKNACVTWEKYNADGNYAELKDVVIPESLIYEDCEYAVTAIGAMAFSRSSLLSIELPSTITTIDRMALSYINGLEKMVIPDNVEKIGDGAFKGCVALQSVETGSSLIEVGNEAFADCEMLTNLVLGKSLRNIGADAFVGDIKLKSIECYSLTPPSFRSSDNLPFAPVVFGTACLQVPDNCRSEYQSADVWKNFNNIGNSNSVKIGPLNYILNEETLSAMTTYDVYQSTDNYKGVKAVMIPEKIVWRDKEYTVSTIGESTFDRCYDIMNFDIPNTVTEIKTDAFCSNHSIKNVVIGDNVTYIGYGAFAYNYGMESVVLGENVRAIGGEAFGYDYNLMSVTCKSEVPPVMEPGRYLTFSSDTYNSGILYVPAGCVDKYRESDWRVFANIEETADESVAVDGLRFLFNDETLEMEATYEMYNTSGNYDGIDKLELAESLIVNSANTRGIRKTASSTKEYRLTSIGEQAFNRATFKEVIIPNSVRNIGRVAFANLQNLEKVTIPRSVEIVGECAFSCSEKLNFVEVGDGAEELGYGAFYQNPSLRSVQLGAGIKSIGGMAFAYSPEITQVLCNAAIPPVVDETSGTVFDREVYENATLYVEDQAVSLYQEAAGWKQFMHILPKSLFPGFDQSSGVEQVNDEDYSGSVLDYSKLSEDAYIECFSLDGVKIYVGKKVNFEWHNGACVIRHEGKAAKVILN